MRSSNSHFKRGNAVIETIFVVLALIITGAVFMFGYVAYKDIREDIVLDSDISESAIQATETTYTNYPSMLDGAIAFMFVGLSIAVIIASFMIDSHPVFFVVSFIILTFVIGAAAMLGNFYEELFTDSSVSDIPSSFPMTNFLLTHLLQVTLAEAALVLISLYAKSRSTG